MHKSEVVSSYDYRHGSFQHADRADRTSLGLLVLALLRRWRLQNDLRCTCVSHLKIALGVSRHEIVVASVHRCNGTWVSWHLIQRVVVQVPDRHRSSAQSSHQDIAWQQAKTANRATLKILLVNRLENVLSAVDLPCFEHAICRRSEDNLLTSVLCEFNCRDWAIMRACHVDLSTLHHQL